MSRICTSCTSFPRFHGRLRKNYQAEIEADRGFRARVIKKIHSSDLKSAEIYGKEYLMQRKSGNWRALSQTVFPEYVALSVDLQKLRRFQLRASVHSLRYESRSRVRRQRKISSCVAPRATASRPV